MSSGATRGTMPKSCKRDIAGQRFGRLVAVSFIPDETKYARWLVRCDCGAEKEVLAQSLIRGATVSCGCFRLEQAAKANTKHGQSGNSKRTRAYSIWAGMMDRCEWGNHPTCYARYGARGIRVCQQWHAFEQFFADMGHPPRGTSLDRIDNDGPYSPENCRWATRREQALNTSRTRRVVVDGRETTVFELCERIGVNRKALRARAQRRGGDYVAALISIGIRNVSAAAR